MRTDYAIDVYQAVKKARDTVWAFQEQYMDS
jgi:hypothetical protein